VIEDLFDTSFVAKLALREKQIQQVYRPVIGVHKWFARRPGTLFRSLLLSEFCKDNLGDAYFDSHNLTGLRIADPFMGGGTPLIEANRMGCDILGFDINPMAWWIVREEIDNLDLVSYSKAVDTLRAELERRIGHLYRTRCAFHGTADMPVKTFLWVKTQDCLACGKNFDLFAGYRIAENIRHPKHVIVCAGCGDLNEVDDPNKLGECETCKSALKLKGNVSRGKATCPFCSRVHRVPEPGVGPYRHRLFALEYVNPENPLVNKGRFFKKPDEADLRNVEIAETAWRKTRSTFVPDDVVPSGDESDRLHRWGLTRYSELFHSRQLLGLELSARMIAKTKDERLQRALATNLSDLLRYQNQLCRYDTMALKVLDIFSIHGFPVGLVHAEANLLGIANPKTGIPVGSGGWLNISEKFLKAKQYCETPFEVRASSKLKVKQHGEWIGPRRSSSDSGREVDIRCANSATATIPDGSLDAVFTDPPYFGNVQYAELIDFCYVWLRRLTKTPQFEPKTTRHQQELTGNVTLNRGIETFTEGLAAIFARMSRALKPRGPLAFTFHHNLLCAYESVAVAILDSRMVCTASLVCPAEMGGSIHISGTGSSIVDTIFVCRSKARLDSKTVVTSVDRLVENINNDLIQLASAGVRPTEGDCRCILAGQLTRSACSALHPQWSDKQSTAMKLALVRQWMARFCEFECLASRIHKTFTSKQGSNLSKSSVSVYVENALTTV
jgi:adenine-specific DNA methylase